MFDTSALNNGFTNGECRGFVSNRRLVRTWRAWCRRLDEYLFRLAGFRVDKVTPNLAPVERDRYCFRSDFAAGVRHLGVQRHLLVGDRREVVDVRGLEQGVRTD